MGINEIAESGSETNIITTPPHQNGKQTNSQLGATLLSTDEHVQEAHLRGKIEEAEARRDALKDTIDVFAKEYNQKFHHEIAEVSLLKAEHNSLLLLVEEKKEVNMWYFIGMGGMGDTSYANAPENDFENLSPEDKKEIKELYKFLARKLHPAAHEGASAEEREGFAQVFKLISDAYDEWDINALRVLAKGFNRDAFQKAKEKDDEILNPACKRNILDALWMVLRDVENEVLRLECSASYQSLLKTRESGDQWRKEEKNKFIQEISQYQQQIEVLKSILADDTRWQA